VHLRGIEQPAVGLLLLLGAMLLGGRVPALFIRDQSLSLSLSPLLLSLAALLLGHQPLLLRFGQSPLRVLGVLIGSLIIVVGAARFGARAGALPDGRQGQGADYGHNHCGRRERAPHASTVSRALSSQLVARHVLQYPGLIEDAFVNPIAHAQRPAGRLVAPRDARK